jgi:tRNA-2-methylthio-N6-dimethylallyladenosine synthase
MNRHDSELIAGALAARGWRRVGETEEADVVLINTCSVRDHAESRVRGRLSELGRGRRHGRRPLIALLGCMAQLRGEEIMGEYPWLDLAMGSGSYARLLEALSSLLASPGRRRERDFLPPEEFWGWETERESGVTAGVPVAGGCGRFCSYCVVPAARGREVSRSPEDVVAEVEKLAAGGWREVTLLGQNVNSYRGRGRDGAEVSFPALLRLVAGTSIARIRFLTSHPADAGSDLAEAMASLTAVCPCLHLPAQSGSNRILKLMNRGYRREEYLATVDRLRRAVPALAIWSDFIAGFPGETGEDHAATLELLRGVRFDGIFAFAYSPRPGTPAAARPDDVSDDLKNRRLREILSLQKGISLAKNRALIGREVEVLVEGTNRRRRDRGEGRNREGRIVFFPAEEGLAGELIRVRVEEATAASLFGRRI